MVCQALFSMTDQNSFTLLALSWALPSHHHSHLPEKETEAQAAVVTCPKATGPVSGRAEMVSEVLFRSLSCSSVMGLNIEAQIPLEEEDPEV